MSDNWICWSLFLDELGCFFLKPSQTICGDVAAVWPFILGFFWPRDSTIFCKLWSFESLCLSNSPSHRALGWYRPTSSPVSFVYFMLIRNSELLPWWWKWNFHCFSPFLKATSLICEAQLSLLHIKIYYLVFSLWWMIKGILALFFLLLIFLWNRKPWLGNFMFIITLECSQLWIWMGIYFRDIYS